MDTTLKTGTRTVTELTAASTALSEGNDRHKYAEERSATHSTGSRSALNCRNDHKALNWMRKAQNWGKVHQVHHSLN